MGLGVLVLSSDRYAHLWPAFFKNWRKYFPNCEYPVYLGSNTVGYADAAVKTLLSDGDPDWSTSLARILRQIPEERVFIILEDLLLSGPLDASAFRECDQFMQKVQAKHIKYYRPDSADRDVEGAPFGVYDRGRPYRISVVGFWHKDYLQSLLIPGENPWNFEIMGSYRTSYSDGFYMMKNRLGEFANLIEKGKWYPSALKWAAREGLDIGAHQRPVLSGFFQAKSLLQKFIYVILRMIPWRWRVGVMNFLRRLLGSY